MHGCVRSVCACRCEECVRAGVRSVCACMGV